MKLCSVCLCNNRNLQPLGNLQETYDIIVQRPHSNGPEVVLCFECRHLLKKCQDFKRKAELAQEIIIAHTIDTSKSCCSNEADNKKPTFSSLAVTYKDTFDYIFSEETSEDEDGYGQSHSSDGFDKSVISRAVHLTNIQPSTSNICIKQEIIDSEEECSLQQLKDRNSIQAKVNKPVAVSDYHSKNIQPSTSNISIKEELVDIEEEVSIKGELVDIEEEVSIKEELVDTEEENDLSQLSDSNPIQVQLSGGYKKVIVIDKEKPPPLRQIAPLRVFASPASKIEIIQLPMPIEEKRIAWLPLEKNQIFHLQSKHPEFKHAEKNMKAFPFPECDHAFPVHSMMEINTDDSYEERKRQLNDSSDDAKVEERNRKNREKYKRYREKKKNTVAVLPVDEKTREERKQRKRENSRRYREKKKNESKAAALSMARADSSCDSFDAELKLARRKQLNTEKCRRYRDKKRKENLQKQYISNPNNVAHTTDT